MRITGRFRAAGAAGYGRIPGLVVVVLLAALGAAACTSRAPASAPAGPAVTGVCPSGLVPVDLSLPKQPADVKLRVLNATGVPGTADFVAGGLSQFGYQVVETADMVGEDDFPEVAVLRFGPRTVGDAWLAKTSFPDPVRLDFDPQRSDDVVDVIVGKGFQFLNTTAEMNQAIAAAGKPTAPAGGCAGN
jgi:hypothetical protein